MSLLHTNAVLLLTVQKASWIFRALHCVCYRGPGGVLHHDTVQYTAPDRTIVEAPFHGCSFVFRALLLTGCGARV